MRFAYLIMAHAAPEQLWALIDRLAAGSTEDRIILHLDRRSTLWREQRERFAGHPSDRVSLVGRPTAVRWGHESIVEAQRLLIASALETGFDYCHLISGADWPTARRETMVRDIARFGDRRPAFIDMLGETQCERMDDWWFERRTLKLPRFPRLEENLERAQIRASWSFSRWFRARGWQRSRLAGQPWLKGSGWWSLPHDIAADLDREIRALQRSGRLHFTQCADEHVVPTLLARRHDDRIEPGFRYIDWRAGGYHPKLLTREDRPAIIASGAWFGRKFDAPTDDFFMAPDCFDGLADAAE